MKEQWFMEYEEARTRTGLPYGHAQLGRLASEQVKAHYADLGDRFQDEQKHEPMEDNQ